MTCVLPLAYMLTLNLSTNHLSIITASTNVSLSLCVCLSLCSGRWVVSTTVPTVVVVVGQNGLSVCLHLISGQRKVTCIAYCTFACFACFLACCSASKRTLFKPSPPVTGSDILSELESAHSSTVVFVTRAIKHL